MALDLDDVGSRYPIGSFIQTFRFQQEVGVQTQVTKKVRACVVGRGLAEQRGSGYPER